MASLSTAHPGDTAGSGRLLWLDVVKGVAIALVVINHAILWPMRAGSLTAAFLYGTCYGTVAAFAAVAGYISARKVIAERREFVRRRARQLLVPWLVWAPVYALAPFAANALGATMPVATEPLAWVLGIAFGGGALWFLPVLFVVTVIATELDARTESWWLFGIGIGTYAGIAGFALIASGKSMSPLAFGHGTLWATVPLYVACYWFGVRVAKGPVKRSAARPTQWPWTALLIGSTLAAGASTLLRETLGFPWLSWTTYFLGAAGGCAGLVLATRVGQDPGRTVRHLASLGSVSLGVYVMHPVVLGPVMFALGEHVTLGVALIAGVFAIGMSSGVVHVYRRVRSR